MRRLGPVMALLALGCTVPDHAVDEVFACDGDRQCLPGFFCDRAARVCVEGEPPPPDAGWMPDLMFQPDQGAPDRGALDQGAPGDAAVDASRPDPDAAAPGTCLDGAGVPVGEGQACVVRREGCVTDVCGQQMKLTERQGTCRDGECSDLGEPFDATMDCPPDTWCGAQGGCAPDPMCDANPCASRRDGLLCQGDAVQPRAWCVAIECCNPAAPQALCNPRGPGHPVPGPDDPVTRFLPDGGALFDPLTGLIWRAARLPVADPGEAAQACAQQAQGANLPTAWRAPDWHELATLVQAREIVRVPEWVEQALTGVAGTRWLVSRSIDPQGGFLALDVYAARWVRLQRGEVAQLSVLCVAGTPQERAPEAWLLDGGPDDPWTGMKWLGLEPVAGDDLPNACPSEDGYRPPTVAEAGSLMDLSGLANGAAVDRLALDGRATRDWYWTGQRVGTSRLALNVRTGEVELRMNAERLPIRCVKRADR